MGLHSLDVVASPRDRQPFVNDDANDHPNADADGLYRLEIHHTVAIGNVPVDELDRRIDRWRALPTWQRILRRSPLIKIGSNITIEAEPLDGVYATDEEALAAAEATADELTGVIRNDSTVAIVRISDGKVVDGFYPNGGGRF